MTARPTVTVVVPCFEDGATLPRTIASLLAQTREDIEILVVDDGSRSDPVGDLPADPRIVREDHPVNRGYAWVTNRAVAVARGTWITFVDADDEVDPAYVEQLLAAGERHDADLVLTPLLAVRGGIPLGTLRFPAAAEVLGPREAYRLAARGDLVLSQHALWRAPRADAPVGLVHSDVVVVLRHIARCRRVALVPEPLYRYTIRPGSETGSLRPAVWDLAMVTDLVEDATAALFSPAEADGVRADLRAHMLTQMLHKAARERRRTPLRDGVYRWCRRRLGVGDVLAAWRRRDGTTALSWTLVLLAPRLHPLVYRTYDALKGRRSARGRRRHPDRVPPP